MNVGAFARRASLSAKLVGAVGAGIALVAAVAEQSSASTEQVSASTQQTSGAAQEIATSAQELAGTAASLERLVSGFKLSA
jgi:methyl-accepting chemotaxis protein